MSHEKILRGRCIVEGVVEGEAIVTNDAISFMGTVNPKTGVVIERKHEIEGQCLKADLCQDLFHGLKHILWLFPPFRAGPCQAIRKATQCYPAAWLGSPVHPG